MKIRQGFVSNSSSSSFICKICGKYAEAIDPYPIELGYGTCNKFGHAICLSHIDKKAQISEEGFFDSQYCPVCNLEIITDEDIIALCTVLFKFSMKDALSMMKSTFMTYDSFDSIVPKYDGIENDIQYCEACLEGYDGYDAGFSSKAFSDCPRGHHVCSHHLSNEGCPICNMTRISYHDYIRLALWHLKRTREEMLAYIRHTFKTYDQFRKELDQIQGVPQC